MYSKNLSATNFIITGQLVLMIGSSEVTHELIFTIPSVIQICTISSINSIRLRFNLEKPRLIRLIASITVTVIVIPCQQALKGCFH